MVPNIRRRRLSASPSLSYQCLAPMDRDREPDNRPAVYVETPRALPASSSFHEHHVDYSS